MIVRDEFLKVGFSHIYSAAKIANLRVSGREVSFWRRLGHQVWRHGGAVAFDSEAGTVQFGRQLEGEEARLLHLLVRKGLAALAGWQE